jgi:REP element-mobilizing transposase RayT
MAIGNEPFKQEIEALTGKRMRDKKSKNYLELPGHPPQLVGRYYVRYINKTYQHIGMLWEGRYKSTLVDSDNYFLLVSRYIELNPVRAHMVLHPAEYP